MPLAAFDGPSPKTPYRHKNLAQISYASRVIAHFVPNFVTMATSGREREQGRKMMKVRRKENGKKERKGKGQEKGEGKERREGEGEMKEEGKGEGKGKGEKKGKGKGKRKEKGKGKENGEWERTSYHHHQFILETQNMTMSENTEQNNKTCLPRVRKTATALTTAHITKSSTV